LKKLSEQDISQPERSDNIKEKTKVEKEAIELVRINPDKEKSKEETKKSFIMLKLY